MDDTKLLLPVRLFDPEADVAIVERRLPHWAQAGTVCFITWRTMDSMPKSVLERWYNDRRAWLERHGIDPARADWKQRLGELGRQTAREFLDTFWNRWHDALDAGHGACELARRDVAEIVARSLRHFDGERYNLLDFIVMPNHVHLLSAFPDEETMLAQCESWKRFTATRINALLGRKGRFWQQDEFDHLVRSEEQFLFLRRYIAENPRKSKLPPGHALHYSRPS